MLGRIPWVLRQGHSCWLLKKDLVSLQTGFTQSGQLSVSCVEHSLFDWMCEYTKSAKACKTEYTAISGRSAWARVHALPASRENGSGYGFFSTGFQNCKVSFLETVGLGRVQRETLGKGPSYPTHCPFSLRSRSKARQL